MKDLGWEFKSHLQMRNKVKKVLSEVKSKGRKTENSCENVQENSTIKASDTLETGQTVGGCSSVSYPFIVVLRKFNIL